MFTLKRWKEISRRRSKERLLEGAKTGVRVSWMDSLTLEARGEEGKNPAPSQAPGGVRGGDGAVGTAALCK